MIICLRPQRRAAPAMLSATKETISVNGHLFDFSSLMDGGVRSSSEIGCEYFVEGIERKDGEVHVSVLFPIGPYADEAARFPREIHATDDVPAEIPDPGFDLRNFPSL